MIDLKHEIERELSMIRPPDLWDRIQAEASDDDAVVLDVTTARRRKRPSLWLAVAAAAASLAVVALATDLLSDRDSVDVTTDPATSPPPSTAGDGEKPIILLNRMSFIDGPLAGGAVDLDVDGEDEDVTGSLELHGAHDGMTITVDCVDTDTETARYDLLAMGGEVTSAPADGAYDLGDRLFLVIRPAERARSDGYPGGGTEGYYRIKLVEAAGGTSCDELIDAEAVDLLADERGWSSTGTSQP